MSSRESFKAAGMNNEWRGMHGWERLDKEKLTLILLTWRIWWAPNNVSRWQMGFKSAFKLGAVWKKCNEKHVKFLQQCPNCEADSNSTRQETPQPFYKKNRKSFFPLFKNHWTPSWATLIQSMPTHTRYLKHVHVLHLYFFLPSFPKWCLYVQVSWP